MTGPGPLDGSVEASNFGVSTGNYVVLNNLLMLLDAAAAAETGHWVSYVPFTHGTLEVTGANTPTFSLQICGSNATVQPADNTDGSAIGSAITSVGMTTITSAPRWIKAKLTSLSGAGATITATLNAFSP